MRNALAVTFGIFMAAALWGQSQTPEQDQQLDIRVDVNGQPYCSTCLPATRAPKPAPVQPQPVQPQTVPQAPPSAPSVIPRAPVRHYSPARIVRTSPPVEVDISLTTSQASPAPTTVIQQPQPTPSTFDRYMELLIAEKERQTNAPPPPPPPPPPVDLTPFLEKVDQTNVLLEKGNAIAKSTRTWTEVGVIFQGFTAVATGYSAVKLHEIDHKLGNIRSDMRGMATTTNGMSNAVTTIMNRPPTSTTINVTANGGQANATNGIWACGRNCSIGTVPVQPPAKPVDP